jgi:hypothetical protein
MFEAPSDQNDTRLHKLKLNSSSASQIISNKAADVAPSLPIFLIAKKEVVTVVDRLIYRI